jgi:lipopolysaccharide assembly protein A
MTEQAQHTEQAERPATTLPPPSPNGAAPPTPTSPATTPSAASQDRRGRPGSRIGQVRTALIAGAVALILVLIFIIENAHAVTIVYFGAHLRLSLAVALLLAAVGGALVMAAAGTARITQLRLSMRRGRRQPRNG